MEALGAAASISALVETTTVLASSIRNIYERWRNAPDDLLTLAALLVSIGARLDIVQCSAIESHALAIDAKSQLFLERLLEEARECILQFEDILVRVQRYGNFLNGLCGLCKRSRGWIRQWERCVLWKSSSQVGCRL